MAYTIQKGGNITVTVDSTAIECLVQSDISSSADELDVTCKNTANTKSYEVGALTTEFTIGGNYTEGTGSNEDYHSLWVKHRAGTEVSLVWGGADSGDVTYTCTAKIMSMSATAGNSGTLVSWTANVKATSDVTVGAVV